jgi:hypothetical protein
LNLSVDRGIRLRAESLRGERGLFEAEAGEFGDGGFGRIGGVDGVGHDVGAKIGADGAGVGLGWIGGAGKGAHAGDGVIAGNCEGDDGGGLHEGFDFGVERLVEEMAVMLGEDVALKGEHLAVRDFEAGFFEAGDDLADLVSENGVGFDENTRCFHE